MSRSFRREQWSLFTSYSCWQQLVLQTKNLSKDHGALSELYSTHLVSRLSQVTEDVQRIYKRVGIHVTMGEMRAEIGLSLIVVLFPVSGDLL